MGPRVNAGQLTEHRPRWTGTHETVQSPPDTMQKRNKAQADTEASQGAGAASSALAQPDRKGAKRGSVSWAPDLAKDLVSDSLTDIATAAHLDPTVAPGREPEAQRARKFSVDAPADREPARPGRGSTGEPRSQTDVLYPHQTRTLPSMQRSFSSLFTFFFFLLGLLNKGQCTLITKHFSKCARILAKRLFFIVLRSKPFYISLIVQIQPGGAPVILHLKHTFKCSTLNAQK
ncbi:hypothetical protein EYF80_063657 [Liparis tanakae]|uniref:Uncharacterized protein n=1 Tax=Liparis tanakae TaxID=230148 RepID=A0A4Z2EBI7_9TELE|nr:hypothetical protein EYF80_063657 [Liparis tanakae]